MRDSVASFVCIGQGWPTFFPQPPILFESSSYPPHKRKTSKFHSETKLISKKKKVNAGKNSLLLKPSCSQKKKVIAGNRGTIGHRLATPDIARYKLGNIFHLKYFPQLQCATTNRPMRHPWRMRRRLATPDIGDRWVEVVLA